MSITKGDVVRMKEGIICPQPFHESYHIVETDLGASVVLLGINFPKHQLELVAKASDLPAFSISHYTFNVAIKVTTKIDRGTVANNIHAGIQSSLLPFAEKRNIGINFDLPQDNCE